MLKWIHRILIILMIQICLVLICIILFFQSPDINLPILMILIFIQLIFTMANILILNSLVSKYRFILMPEDQLTGLNNRQAMQIQLYHATELANRYHQPLFLMILDIDFMKDINNRYGRNTGNRIIKHIAKLVKKNIRKSDFFARFGGEEFMILYPQTHIDGAVEFAEKIRSIIQNRQWIKKHPVTISVGITQYIENETMEAFIDRGDKALLKAKTNGKNRVEVNIL